MDLFATLLNMDVSEELAKTLVKKNDQLSSTVQVVESAPFPIFQIDLKGEIIYGNYSFHRMLGTSDYKLINTQWQNYIIESDQIMVERIWHLLMEHKSDQTIDITYINPTLKKSYPSRVFLLWLNNSSSYVGYVLPSNFEKFP